MVQVGKGGADEGWHFKQTLMMKSWRGERNLIGNFVWIWGEEDKLGKAHQLHWGPAPDTLWGCLARARESVCVLFHLGVSTAPPPAPMRFCHGHVVAVTIGPCFANILLTFDGSCPCHLETKTNGPTSRPLACKTLYCSR